MAGEGTASVTSDAAPARRGYRAVFRHPVGARLITTQIISDLGDFVGLSALLLLAYRSTGSVLAPAAVYAARSLPALLVATAFSGWLDRPQRRTLLVACTLAGAAIIAVPTVHPNAWTGIVAAALLGAMRAVYRSTNTAVIAESMTRDERLPLFGVAAIVGQSAQVIGIVVGAGLTLSIGVRWALGLDVLSFLLAAGVLATLPLTVRVARPRRPPPTAGFRLVFAHPTLRSLAVLTWVSFLINGFPETVAPRLAHGGFLPVLMASWAIGGGLFSAVLARGRFLDRPLHQVALAAMVGGLLLSAGVTLVFGGPVWLVAVFNGLAGGCACWVVGAQATFAHLAPPERMGQVEATVVAANILMGGLGALALGWLTSAVGPAPAYLTGGVLVAVAGVVAVRRFAGRPAEV